MAGGQISQKARDFVVIIHKSRPIVKSRASGECRRGIAPVQIAQKLPVQTVAVCGYLEPLAAVVFAAAARDDAAAADTRCGAHPLRCRWRRVHAHAAATAPEVLSRFAYRQTAQRRVRSFFLRPAGVRESTGAQAGQKNRRHTSVCRRFVHLALRSREPLIDARRTMVYSERAVCTRAAGGGHP